MSGFSLCHRHGGQTDTGRSSKHNKAAGLGGHNTEVPARFWTDLSVDCMGNRPLLAVSWKMGEVPLTVGFALDSVKCPSNGNCPWQWKVS